MATYSRMLKYLRPYWRRLIATGFCIVAYAILSGASILSVSPFVRILFSPATEMQNAEPPSHEAIKDGHPINLVPQSGQRMLTGLRQKVENFLFAGSRTDALKRFCLLLLLLFLLKNLFHYGQTYLTSSLEQSALRDIRKQLYSSISHLRLGIFVQEKTGNFISRMVNDVALMRTALVGGAASILRNGLMLLLALSILIAASWKLALAAMLILPPNAFLIAKLGKRLRKRSGRAQCSMAEMANVVQETVTGARVVRAFGMDQYEGQRFGSANHEYFRNYLRVRLLQAMASPISEMLAILAIVAILWFGGKLVLEEDLGKDRLFLFLTAMLWLTEPVKQLIGVHSTLQEGLVAGERVFALMDLSREPHLKEGAKAIFDDELRFENVCFGYDAERPVLRDINLCVHPGDVIALVGPSGAGKSTLVDLLPRFYETSSGRILLDGRETRTLSLESLRELFGIVTQEIILFHASVRDNIAYGLPSTRHDQIEQAARAANAHEFICGLPQGYETPIGERGVMLSGGERQRISIARAILRDPEILILDEATSSLDTQSERLIQEALDRLMQNRTAFVVAHRLSTIRRADTILVLEAGRIVESGNNDDLLAQNGAYARLHDLQFRAAQ